MAHLYAGGQLVQPGLGRGAEQDGCVVNLTMFYCYQFLYKIIIFILSPEHFLAAAEAPQALGG